MKKTAAIINKTSVICAWICVVLLVALMAMYVTDVTGRFIFGRQIKGTFEMAQFVLCIMTFGSYGYTQTVRGHIQVGFLTRLFPPKLKYSVYGAGYVLCAVMGCITVYALWLVAKNALLMNKATTVISLPYAPLYIANAVLMAVFVLTLALDIARCILAVRGDGDAQESINAISL
ncbi:MAG: TRAP transporter small permease [Clostridiales Family XIII bacterium]|jgi:TRAP-type C4-dicarboxylate transport system permease small subunit|nr:TRAP transporter small permease [Clostridiales Family XIII bacterium]